MLIDYLKKHQIELIKIEKYNDPLKKSMMFIKFKIKTGYYNYPYTLSIRKIENDYVFQGLRHGKIEEHQNENNNRLIICPLCNDALSFNCGGYTQENLNETFSLLMERIKEEIIKNPKFRLRFLNF